MVAMLPLVSVMLLCLFWGIVYVFKRRNKEKIKKNLTLSVVVVLFLIYPTMITTSFGLFNFKELNKGEQWLLRDLQVECWNSDHKKWAFVIGIPIIIFWVIGIPLVGVRILYRRRQVLDEEETLARYKMMYQGLRRRVYYWEFVNLLRKLCVISINVFLSTVDANYQVRVRP